MILIIDTAEIDFVVTRRPTAKLDQSGQQRFSKDRKLAMWSTQVVATDVSGGEVISVNTEGEAPPQVQVGDLVEITNLVALPWASNGRSGISFKADSIKVAPEILD